MARPVRLCLRASFGHDIDGAWWPHTASVATELPELVEHLQRSLGVIIGITVNWSATEGAPDLTTMWSGARPTGEPRRAPRLMVVGGRTESARLLVIPHMTSGELGPLVLRLAAAKPPATTPQEPKLLEIGDCVMRAAEAESRRWAAESAVG